MKSYKLEFHRFESLTDEKSKGKTKKKIQKVVRHQLKRQTSREILDPEFDKRPTRKN